MYYQLAQATALASFAVMAPVKVATLNASATIVPRAALIPARPPPRPSSGRVFRSWQRAGATVPAGEHRASALFPLAHACGAAPFAPGPLPLNGRGKCGVVAASGSSVWPLVSEEETARNQAWGVACLRSAEKPPLHSLFRTACTADRGRTRCATTPQAAPCAERSVP